MSVFINHLIQYKKYSMIILFIVFICGFFFGFYQYSYTQDTVTHYLQTLFYLNHDEYINYYTIYLYENILFIIICTYLSSSYLGAFGILIMLFLKGLQVSFSLIYVINSVTLTMIIVFLLMIEICIEIIFIFILSIHCIHISLYVAYVTFFSKQQLSMRSILNYLLNYLIITFIILTISLCFRIYLIPLF